LSPDLAKDVLWSNGSKNNTLNIAKPGKYSVKYTDKNGCSKVESFEVNQIFLPQVQLGEDIQSCKDSLVIIQISNENKNIIKWSDGSTDAQKVISQDGRYTITLTNECGEVSDNISVEFKDCSARLLFSNIFTPNGDGNNDQFVLKGDYISHVIIKFYDRWGNLIFEKDDQDTSIITWAGKFDSKFVKPGVYTFVMLYTENISGKSKFFHGNTTVMY
jgi:large repetitive protein